MRHVRVAVLPVLAAVAAAGDMQLVAAVVNHSGGGGGGGGDWWAGAAEEDAIRSLSLDGDGGLWASSFVPPPPRPEYLEESVSPDGLTTCDLCTWAWHNRGGMQPVDAVQSSAGELGWVFTLAIVSVLSAAIGAVVMIILLHCRNRIKNTGPTCLYPLCTSRSPDPSCIATPRQSTGDKSVTPGAGRAPPPRTWPAWLSLRRPAPGPLQLSATPTAPENHYTLDETYTSVDEALYAELDRESNPAYQNTAYDEEEDVAMSSAPSSAYYSDLSYTDRTYEAVGTGLSGGAVGGGWEGSDLQFRRHPKLSAINETIKVPSDYV